MNEIKLLAIKSLPFSFNIFSIAYMYKTEFPVENVTIEKLNEGSMKIITKIQ